MTGQRRYSGRARQLRATAIGVVAILLWASLAILTVNSRGIPSFELLALTFGIAFLAGLTTLALRGPQGLAELRQPVVPWLAAFAGIFLYHALYFYALSNAPPAQASLIAYLWPLLIVVLSVLSTGERLRAQYLIGAVMGLAGTAIFLLEKQDGATGIGSAAGYAAAFGCALVWSIYSVLNRRFRNTPSGMLVGVCGAVCVAGAVCHLLLEKTVWPHGGQWLAIAALGVGPTGLAFLAWDHATKHGSLPLLGTSAYLAPLISTLLLIILGKTEATWAILAAAGLIIGGAVIASRPPKERLAQAS